MMGMFFDCSNLTSLDLSSFKTSKVTIMNAMFSGCSDLTELDLASFNTKDVTNMHQMFYNCEKLLKIYIGTGWDISNVVGTNTSSPGDIMFIGCKKLPNFNPYVTDITKAHAGPDGYLTLKA
mgnify:FL=1|jgi:surface protein